VNKVAIITDSVSCLPKEQAEKYGIHIVPVKILFGNKVYSNGVDLDAAEAYQLLDKAPDSFSTAPSPPNDYINLFREIVNRGQDILCISVSSKLSTVFNVACLAKDNLLQENPEATIAIVDSMTATATQGLIVLAAARSAIEGRQLDEVILTANKVREHAYMFLALDTIRHAYRTGRIPKIATQVGSALGVKPLLTISNGVVHLVSVSRTMKSGKEKLVDNMKRRTGEQAVHAAVMHTAIPEEGEKLKQRIAGEFDCKELLLTEVSPIIGYAIGTGALGIAFYSLPDENN